MIILLILSIISLLSIGVLLIQNFYLLFLGITSLSLSWGFHGKIWATNIISLLISYAGLYIFREAMELDDAVVSKGVVENEI